MSLVTRFTRHLPEETTHARGVDHAHDGAARFTRTRRRSGSDPVRCTACARTTFDPRRGLCFACYQRERRGAVVDACAVCGLADARMLTRRTLADGMRVLCGNHAAALGKRRVTLAALTAELVPAGDRRQSDRRSGDRRAASDRRATLDVAWLVDGDRRGAGRRATDAA